MKLDLSFVDYLQNLLHVCKLTGIESLIIDKDVIRGLHPDRLSAIVHTDNIPMLPFGSIGISRVNELQARIDIARSLQDFAIEFTLKPETDFVFNLTLKAKGTKIDFRCADPSKIEARRSIKDPMHHKARFTPDAISMLSKGIGATKAEAVTLISNSEGVSFELLDNNKDVFKFIFGESSENVAVESVGKFAHRYPAKVLHTLAKENPNGYFYIGSQGLLKINIHNTDVYLQPYASNTR